MSKKNEAAETKSWTGGAASNAKSREELMEDIVCQRAKHYFWVITFEHIIAYLIAIICAVYDQENTWFGLPPNGRGLLISYSITGDVSRSVTSVLIGFVVAGLMTYLSKESHLMGIILMTELSRNNLNDDDFVKAMNYVEGRRIISGIALLLVVGIVAFDGQINMIFAAIHILLAGVVWICIIIAQAKYRSFEKFMIEKKVFQQESFWVKFHYWATILSFVGMQCCNAGIQYNIVVVIMALCEYGIMIFGVAGLLMPTYHLTYTYRDQYDFSQTALQEPFSMTIVMYRAFDFLERMARWVYESCRTSFCKGALGTEVSCKTTYEQTVAAICKAAKMAAEKKEN